ncbi:MAG TPA: aminotransferase class V-fold PLP-dependent enzyme [Deltaproteobacteria bacterium]|nr:aminotransferase class V-fold PLP-dependent enzyme [Deltaproteobacteria bacterium]
MSPEAFRAAGYAAIDWIVRYLEQIESYPVRSRAEPGQLRRRLPRAAPEQGESFDDVLRDLDELILPGITHWQSPGFFAYFPANSSPPGILGELLSVGLGVQGMMWVTSPAATELESHVLDWLVGALGLPEAFLCTGAGGGVIQDSASSAALCALVAAREQTRGEGGLRRLRLYASTQAHSSIAKGAKIAGFEPDQLRLIEVDDALAMRPDALAAAIEADVADGVRPCFVCATVGTTATTAIDPVPAIAEICRPHGVWLHVDGAYAGSAAICPELRWVNEGLDQVDSYCFNPHKWLLTPFDCTVLWVADRRPLIDAMRIDPDYLHNAASASEAVIDYRDWHVPLGRRFRALKLWTVLRSYGLQGLRDHVRRHVQLAQQLAERIDAHPRLERLAPTRLGLVCFRLRASDEDNQRLLDALNDSGALYLTHARVHDRLFLRMAVGGRLTEARHVEAAWAQIVSRVGDPG